MNDNHNEFSIAFLKKYKEILISTLLLGYLVPKIFDYMIDFIRIRMPIWNSQISYAILSYLIPKISNCSQQSASIFTLYILIIAVILCIFFINYSTNRIYKINKERTLQHIKELENHDSDTTITESTEETPLPDKVTELNKLKKYLKTERIYMIIFQFICIIGYVAITISYLSICISAEQATRLTNNIEIVSPYISDLEYKQLKSDFYTMETYEDYSLLVNSLSEIAEDHSLKLK